MGLLDFFGYGSQPVGILQDDPNLEMNMANRTSQFSYLPVNTLPQAYNDPRMQAVIKGHARMGPSRAEVLANPQAFNTPDRPNMAIPQSRPYLDPIMQIGANKKAAAMGMTLPKPKPEMQGPMPAPKPMGAPDFVTMMPGQRPQLVKPQQTQQQQQQQSMFGGLLSDDMSSGTAQANMAAAAALLKAGAPQVGKPTSLGSGIGDAINAYMGTKRQAEQDAIAKKDSDLNRQYKTAIMEDMARKADMPTTQFLANGAFSAVTDPKTGDVTITKNEDIHAYLQDQALIKRGAGAGLTPLQKKIDEKYAPEYMEFIVNGGAADVEKGIEQLDTAVAMLAKGGMQSGTIVENLPRVFRNFLNEDGVVIEDLVAEVTQRNLRAVLGGQFAQKEGEMLIARAYDPKLSEEENTKRLTRLTRSIERAYDQKMRAARYYEKTGTLDGFKGSWNITMDSIAADAGMSDYKDVADQAPQAGYEYDMPEMDGGA